MVASPQIIYLKVLNDNIQMLYRKMKMTTVERPPKLLANFITSFPQSKFCRVSVL
jgi:hypothetical protein